MVRKYLGDEIDIHGGAEDLIFPHHENEIAQTEALTGKDFAKYWMHCGILTTDHKKMSKSRGNFATLRDVAEKVPHDVIRFYFLSGHYRMPMEFTDEVLAAAKQGLTRIRNCYNNIAHALKTADNDIADKQSAPEEKHFQHLKIHEENFIRAMDDDFNTAVAITAIFQLVTEINILMGEGTLPKNFLTAAGEKLIQLMDILGIKIKSDSTEASTDENAEIEAFIAARQDARKNKNFAESDRIRDELLSRGIILEDTREGVRWHRA